MAKVGFEPGVKKSVRVIDAESGDDVIDDLTDAKVTDEAAK